MSAPSQIHCWTGDQGLLDGVVLPLLWRCWHIFNIDFFGKGQRVFKKWMEFTNFGRMFQLRGVREAPKNFPIVSVSRNAARVVKSSLVILAVYAGSMWFTLGVIS